MISDVHLTGTTHCPERVFTTHNSTPHERKLSTQNMTAKGTRNMIDNILVDIETLRYTCPFYPKKALFIAQRFATYTRKSCKNQKAKMKESKQNDREIEYRTTT